MKRILLSCIAALVFSCIGSVVLAGPNILFNGSFDVPSNTLSLAGWTYDYQYTGNRFYMGNHMNVSVVPKDGTRKNVLRLFAPGAIAEQQGTIVDSKPIPFEPGSKYKLTVWGRAEGLNCRILFEGYQWAPGVKPHDDAEFNELRKVYKQGSGSLAYFPRGGGDFSGVGPTWQKATTTFPSDNLSELAMDHLKKVDFIVVHICAIKGGTGNLYIDDVSVEKIK